MVLRGNTLLSHKNSLAAYSLKRAICPVVFLVMWLLSLRKSTFFKNQFFGSYRLFLGLSSRASNCTTLKLRLHPTPFWCNAPLHDTTWLSTYEPAAGWPWSTSTYVCFSDFVMKSPRFRLWYCCTRLNSLQVELRGKAAENWRCLVMPDETLL